jgi:hypothetical protein
MLAAVPAPLAEVGIGKELPTSVVLAVAANLAACLCSIHCRVLSSVVNLPLV